MSSDTTTWSPSLWMCRCDNPKSNIYINICTSIRNGAMSLRQSDRHISMYILGRTSWCYIYRITPPMLYILTSDLGLKHHISTIYDLHLTCHLYSMLKNLRNNFSSLFIASKLSLVFVWEVQEKLKEGSNKFHIWKAFCAAKLMVFCLWVHSVLFKFY